MKLVNLLFLGVFLVISPQVFACFNDSGCPKGNVCVKTGNIMGICFSSGTPVSTTVVNTPAGSASIANPTSSTGATGIVPGTTGVHVPVIPGYVPPVTAGSCTNDINCKPGFVCAHPNGAFTGVCTQVAQ